MRELSPPSRAAVVKARRKRVTAVQRVGQHFTDRLCEELQSMSAMAREQQQELLEEIRDSKRKDEESNARMCQILDNVLSIIAIKLGRSRPYSNGAQSENKFAGIQTSTSVMQGEHNLAAKHIAGIRSTTEGRESRICHMMCDDCGHIQTVDNDEPLGEEVCNIRDRDVDHGGTDVVVGGGDALLERERGPGPGHHEHSPHPPVEEEEDGLWECDVKCQRGSPFLLESTLLPNRRSLENEFNNCSPKASSIAVPHPPPPHSNRKGLWTECRHATMSGHDRALGKVDHSDPDPLHSVLKYRHTDIVVRQHGSPSVLESTTSTHGGNLEDAFNRCSPWAHSERTGMLSECQHATVSGHDRALGQVLVSDPDPLSSILNYRRAEVVERRRGSPSLLESAPLTKRRNLEDAFERRSPRAHPDRTGLLSECHHATVGRHDRALGKVLVSDPDPLPSVLKYRDSETVERQHGSPSLLESMLLQKMRTCQGKHRHFSPWATKNEGGQAASLHSATGGVISHAEVQGVASEHALSPSTLAAPARPALLVSYGLSDEEVPQPLVPETQDIPCQANRMPVRMEPGVFVPDTQVSLASGRAPRTRKPKKVFSPVL